MEKNEWVKDIALILLGIIIGHLLSPNEQVQTFLQSVFASRLWGFPMATIILIIVAIITAIMLWRLERAERKNKPPKNVLENKIDAIIDKLNISQEDIQKASEKDKKPTD